MASRPGDFHPADVLFTPPEAATATAEALAYRREHRGEGIYLGIREIDHYLTPVLPDNLVTILGRPGAGKTGLMMWWARSEAGKLYRRGETNKVVVYVTYEQSVEDLMAFNVAADKGLGVDAMAAGKLSDAEWDAVMRSLTGAVTLPLVIIGHSAQKRRRRPRLTLTNVAATLAYLVDEMELTPHLVFVDYLQRIPGEKYAGDRRMEVSENLDRCKDGALAFGAPWVVGVQAKREVDTRQVPVPVLADGQETANIEQASDKVLGIVRPCKYRKDGEQFGSVVVRGRNQMHVSILKQKLGRDNESAWIDFDPAYNRLLENDHESESH